MPLRGTREAQKGVKREKTPWRTSARKETINTTQHYIKEEEIAIYQAVPLRYTYKGRRSPFVPQNDFPTERSPAGAGRRPACRGVRSAHRGSRSEEHTS